MHGPTAFPLSLTEPLTRSLATAEPLRAEPEPEARVRLTRDLTTSLQRELWHEADQLAIAAAGDDDV